MKHKSILSFLTFALSACLLTTSCEDMLTPDLDRYATENEFGKDSIYSAIGVLRSIQNVAERTVLLGECRGDLVTSGTYTTDSIGNIIDFGEVTNGSSALLNVADYYHIVNSCNFYLANVDTTVTQNNVKIMQREWAQVQAMRGWAYIQLVRLYGEVPFVTTPVASTNEAENLQKSAPKVNAANLASMLVEAGLGKAYDLQHALGIPDYGTFTSGDGDYPSTANFFPVQVVLGDAYLMGNDYENAARYYYDFFIYDAKQNPSYYSSLESASYTHYIINDIESKLVSSGTLPNAINDNSLNSGQTITGATSAKTSADGRVFNVLQDVTGFKTEEGSLSSHEQYMQLMPSQQYVSLNKAQRFNKFEVDNDVFVREEYSGGDGRLYAFAPRVVFRNGNSSNIITKFALPYQAFINEQTEIRYSGFAKNYQIPLYRTTLVLLRYAEAVNRLGFPELAFGILKDGLFTQNLPTLGKTDIVKSANKLVRVMDTEADTLIRVDTLKALVVGKLSTDGISASVSYASDSSQVVYGDKYVGDTIWAVAPTEDYAGTTLADIPEDVQEKWYDVEYMLEPRAITGGMYYLSMEERKAMTAYPFMEFTNMASVWDNTGLIENYDSYGVHSRGCGATAGICDTLYIYSRQVAEKMAEDKARKEGLSYADQLAYAQTLYHGDTLLVDDKAAIINAVENLIVDEAALEGAFEGHRFTDLIRIAGHKDDAGSDGTAWLAWKVGRRNQNVTDDASQVDATLRSKMLSKDNWYLPMPE